MMSLITHSVKEANFKEVKEIAFLQTLKHFKQNSPGSQRNRKQFIVNLILRVKYRLKQEMKVTLT